MKAMAAPCGSGSWNRAQASHAALGCGWSIVTLACVLVGSCLSSATGRSCSDPETGAKEMAIAMTRLAGLLGDVRAASVFRYDVHDSAGNRMDTAKVILNPAGG